MKHLLSASLLSACLLVGAGQLRADFVATASMLASTDNATNSQGSGTAVINYNTAADTFTYNLSWQNLTGDTTMGHIHLGPPGVSGPIIIPFYMSSLPATGTLNGTLTATDITPAMGVTTIAEVAQNIESGNAYVNLHTAQYPNGEIRGQLAVTSAVPEPTSVLLTALGSSSLLGFAIMRRKRQVRL